MDFLDKFGEIGHYISLELKLILRNKRSKPILIMSLLFVLYGLFFYSHDRYMEGFGFLVFAGTFISGLFILSFGNFFLSWDSNFFDLILSKNIDPHKYFLSKFMIMIIGSSITFILSIPYAFFGWKITLINSCMFLYNIGVTSFLTIYFATSNPKKIDLNRGAAFNYQGTTAEHFIVMIPALLVPPLFILPFNYFGIPYVGILILGGSGLISLSLYKVWINRLLRRFLNKKYKIAENFRQE